MFVKIPAFCDFGVYSIDFGVPGSPDTVGVSSTFDWYGRDSTDRFLLRDLKNEKSILFYFQSSVKLRIRSVKLDKKYIKLMILVFVISLLIMYEILSKYIFLILFNFNESIT